MKKEVTALRAFLKARNIPSYVAAVAMGVSPQSLYHWFSGAGHPKEKNLERIRNYLEAEKKKK